MSSVFYGPTGAPNQSRVQIAADPRRMLPIRVAGPMYDWGTPAHTIGLSGAAYSYNGSLTVPSPAGIELFGLSNMIHNGTAAHAIGKINFEAGPITLNLGGVGFYDVIASEGINSQIISNQFTSNTQYTLMSNGEAAYRQTLAANYGASNELFTSAGTISQVTNGSTAILGAATLFTTAT